MFERFHTVGYKCLRNLEMPFEDFVLLLGPNGSGKSSVLDGVHVVGQLGRTWPEKLFTGAHSLGKLRSSNYPGSMKLGLQGQVDDAPVSIEFESDPDVFPDDFRLEASVAGQPHTVSPNANANVKSGRQPLFRDKTIGDLGRVVRLRLEPRLLASPSYTKSDHPRVEYSGLGLASALAHMALFAPESFSELQDSLRSVVPTVRRLRFEKLSLTEVEHTREFDPEQGREISSRVERRVPGEGLLLDLSNATGVPAQHASEGTLLVLGILAVVLQDAARVILVDDLDRGLHPRACSTFVQQLMSLATTRGLQIIGSAHSPFLVDHVPAAQVRLLALDDSGCTRWKRLSDHSDYDRFRDELSPGEFWSSVGEEWVLTQTKGDDRAMETAANE